MGLIKLCNIYGLYNRYKYVHQDYTFVPTNHRSSPPRPYIHQCILSITYKPG